MTVVSDLPPLTGNPLLDPWRIRLRLELAGELEQPARGVSETPTERMLWELLEHEPPGWQREYSTGLYRLDFYCPTLRLAVEVDGGSHFGRQGMERDALRDEWHSLRGIRTKRFSVREVENDASWVMDEIRGLTGRLPAAAEQAALPVDDEREPVAPAADSGPQLLDAALVEAWPVEQLIAEACRTVLPADAKRARGRILELLNI